jgi:protein O-GlcNAc transferase
LAPELLLATAKARAEVLEKFVAPLRQPLVLAHAGPTADGRLRIGYVSGDFRDHATAHLTRKLFHLHDRRRFEIIGYTLRPGDGSAYWRDISDACDRMVDLGPLSNREAAERIAADGVHVLVDLHGYTKYGRQEIFALRPAPVQVGFLGYPGTLGGHYIPYLIADEVVLPEDLRACFSEQPVYLPDCYQINDNEQPIAQTGMTRADQGLPEDAFVYASFSTGYKIEPTTFASWMKILQQAPGSVLWLLADNPRMDYYLRRAAGERGVDPGRLIFAKRLPKPEHLERQRLADLYLDTFVVNAHTTASDALWVGLPVLTLCGRTFQARVCASVLYAVGLPELVTYTASDYEALALALALVEDRSRLAGLRERLHVNRLTCPLFDTEGYVRHLERAYELLWWERQAGRPAHPLWVAPIMRSGRGICSPD